MKKLYSIVGMWIVSAFCLLSAQSRVYSSVENVHSHNDYLQNVPFYTAYSARCASIEADVFLVDGELYVAHKENEINKARKLRNLYLNPIREQFEMNGGSGYPNGKSFQLLIDLKTDYKETMKVLEQQLLEYRDCFDVKKNPLAVRVVVSGFLPSPEEFSNYADFIFFDGRPRFIYTPEQSLRIPMMSTSFRTLTQWNGLGRMVETDYNKVKAFIDKAHAEGKAARFWGCPDTKTAWNTFMKLGLDYLNTDHPALLDDFLKRYPKNFIPARESFMRFINPPIKMTEARKCLIMS